MDRREKNLIFLVIEIVLILAGIIYGISEYLRCGENTVACFGILILAIIFLISFLIKNVKT